MKNIKSKIFLKNVKVHNLKGVDLELTTNELIVFTGVSGSGKSSLAFDTLFVEGQRRYIESLSTFARRYIGDMAKPDVELVLGLSPTIAIEQKTSGKNPRSTVATLTELYDYMRVLFARVATAYCPISLEPVTPQSKETIIKKIQHYPEKTKLLILAPFANKKKGEFKEDFQFLLRKGYTRAIVDGNFLDLSEEVELDKNLAHDIQVVIDRISVSEENHSRIAESVLAALELGKGSMMVVEVDSKQEAFFSTHGYSRKSGVSYPALEPQDFSFNSPSGMCPDCNGLGRSLEFDLEKIIDQDKSLSEDCVRIASSYNTVRYGNIYDNLAEMYGFDVHTPWRELPQKAKQIFLYGSDKKWIPMHFTHPNRPVSWTEYVQWRGVIFDAKQRYAEATSEGYREKIHKLMHESVCNGCSGSRLKPYPSHALLGGKKIHEITAMPISECLDFFQNLKLEKTEAIIAEELLKEIERRLKFLLDVGLHYLTLDRTSPTLSGGEAQRVRLASQVGSGLVGVTYILDEPSIGLHPRDNQKLIESLKRLRDIGNTVIVVEHDEETILQADRVVEFGPGPGVHGGEILVNGSLQDLFEHPLSLTGSYLSGKKQIPIPQERRKIGKERITIHKASHNNLKEIDATFPLGVMIAITGVSGSGKSSLISDTLYPALSNRLHFGQHSVGAHKKITGIENIDKVIAIDQSAIGRTPRSNPATYVKIFDDIRQLFSKLPDSVAKGFSAGRFSFNVREGSCPSCHGMGMVRIDMDFLEDQWTVCQSCKSKRFDHETLSIHYKGKNISDVLNMSVDDALSFFENIPPIKKKLEVLSKVGMGYIQLGQSSTTLSGGEAQRIKLAKELVRPGTGKTFYILDEPTTGLHFHDIHALLNVLHNLVDRGNTVLVIEHNMDVVKTVDWILDLGIEGGAKGGQLLATGTPEEIAKKQTPTGKALKDSLYPTKKIPEAAKQSKLSEIDHISLKGAEQNNLKHLDLKIPRGQMSVCTGPSGSGKSSLAFETVYAEGQRRYIESLSPYARQFVKQMPKPKLTQIEGLSPAIAIEQKATGGNPRSTVGTLTEVYDYLRILFARAGTAYCPETREKIQSITKEYVVEKILEYPEGKKITLLAPIRLEKNEKFEDLTSRLRRFGYVRLRLNNEVFELDGPIPFDRKRKNEIALVIDRMKVSKQNEGRIHEAVEAASLISEGKILVAKEEGDSLFNLAFAVESTGKSYPEITPQTFSFNSSSGMCMECQGLGYQYGADFAQNEELMDFSISELLRSFWTIPSLPFFEKFFKKEGIDTHLPLSKLKQDQLIFFLNGTESWMDAKEGFSFRWLGIQPILAKAGKIAHTEIRAPLVSLLHEIECMACLGSRLNPLAANVKIADETLASLCSMPLLKAKNFIEKIPLDKKQQKLLEEVIKQLTSRLDFLVEVGLDYLSLDRRAPTLSNGEAQRIRLARQLGSSLTGILYVLDEPTIGLHPQDSARLIRSLKKLKDLGNTLLLVEHDQMTIKEADYIFDFGPGAGEHGGHITAQGSYESLLKNPRSLTGAYFSQKQAIPIPKKRRTPKAYYPISHARLHNLKDLSVDLPLGVMTCLTGVSGSGKSTLMHESLLPLVQASIKESKRFRQTELQESKTKEKGRLKASDKPKSTPIDLKIKDPFNKLIVIDQNPIGHTVRADVGSYSEVLPVLREFYASLAGARAKGLQPRHFSYNHKKGMCSGCYGLGYKKVEMLFLPAVKVVCDQCHGLRLNPLSLSVNYKNMNFGQLLNTTVEEAILIFDVLPKAKRILTTLKKVGLSYLKLGQEINSLSGGEAQRIKLSRELSKRGTGKTLYLLDEPTTGLHPEDIKKLLELLHSLVDKGNTMLIIEHQLDVIKNCDFVFDMGPGAGEHGGKIVALGTPEEIASNPDSITGKFL